jgi:ribonuclease T2
MNKRLCTLALLVVLGCFLSVHGFAKSKKKPAPSSDASKGDFDYFLLTLSWAPEFCATNTKGGKTPECDPNKHMGLVVHGLWPQYDNGKWPQDCGSTPPVSSSIVKHMLPIMPGKDLIQHEWSKHGTCSALSVQDYFGVIEKLYNGLTVPEDFKAPSTNAQTSPAKIEKEFATANAAPVGAFRISCPQSKFSAVEICLTKDLQYQACPATVKECRSKNIAVRPVP